MLAVGMQQRWPGSAHQDVLRTSQLVAPGASIWLPALCCSATYLALQPAGKFHPWFTLVLPLVDPYLYPCLYPCFTLVLPRYYPVDP